jgi:hypothetical protein
MTAMATAGRAVEVAAEVAGRLADPRHIRDRAGHTPAHRAFPGCAVLAARASAGRPDLAGAATALCRAAIDGLPAPVNSIAQGTMGVTAAALVTHAMTGDERLRPVISSGLPWLSGRVLGIAERYRGHDAAGGPAVLVTHYDAIAGLAGLGRLLLMATRTVSPGPSAVWTPPWTCSPACSPPVATGRDGGRPGRTPPSGCPGTGRARR